MRSAPKSFRQRRGADRLHLRLRRARQRPIAAPGLSRTVEAAPVSYTHLRAHETVLDLVCRLLLEKKTKKQKKKNKKKKKNIITLQR